MILHRKRQHLGIQIAIGLLVLLSLACSADAANSLTSTSQVIVFTPSMSQISIQSTCDSIFSQQQNNEFGGQRYALLFEPGTYNVDLNVGYYTQVIGLGQHPSDTVINGYVQCLDGSNGTALTNFWRGVENITINPVDSGGTNFWAVSQAAPMRRVHVLGNLALSDFGAFSSGGFLANSIVDGGIFSWSQQQWCSRNNSYASWSNGVWNQVFVGDSNPPSGTFPSVAYTVVGKTPIIREKPYLVVKNGNWQVMVPSLRKNATGPDWTTSQSASAEAIPLSRFYIAHPDTDTARTINDALLRGLNLLLTPGVYTLKEPIRVLWSHTIVLGLGLATLQPVNGTAAMSVFDSDGVDISGILFDAGPEHSPCLLRIGDQFACFRHESDPITLHDDFFRIGGAANHATSVDKCLEINSPDVICDNLWLWRADHGSGVGWTENLAQNGLVVNGANTTIYGLAVEHFQQYQTVWNANGGRLYFYQSEEPYDPPTQSAWMNGLEDGYASYKVGKDVKTHQAYGVGVYCNFDVNPSVALSNAIECPNTPGVQFNDMVTVSLGGQGTISNIIDNTGGAVNSSNQQQDLANFP